MTFLANWIVCKVKGHDWVKDDDGTLWAFHDMYGREVHYCNRCSTMKEI